MYFTESAIFIQGRQFQRLCLHKAASEKGSILKGKKLLPILSRPLFRRMAKKKKKKKKTDMGFALFRLVDCVLSILICFILTSRKHIFIILTPLNPIKYSKTAVYRGLHYCSYFCSKT